MVSLLRSGWGRSPVTAEGWVMLTAGIAAAIALASSLPHAWWVSLIAVAVMLDVILLKGTSPGGGPDEWRELRAAQDGNRDS